jgi:hypothetical protein
MSRTTVNFLLDATMLSIFLTIVFCGVVLRFVFPPAASAANWILWGATYDDWAQFQFGALCLFTFAILIHLMLHWSWICGVVSNRLTQWCETPVRIDEASRTVYGVGLLIVVVNVVGVSIAAAALMIQPPGY